MAEITLREVRYAYRDQAPAIRELSAHLPAGASLALVGPNGSGKSTLLRLLFGALIPDAGEVLIDGAPVGGADPRRRLSRVVARVPSSQHLPFRFRVAEVVMMGRIPHQGPWGAERAVDREAVGHALDALDVRHLAGRAFSECSAGEQQRVLLAKALAQQPRLLLLDEASAHLDLRHLTDLVSRLRRLHEGGLTLVFATHDLNLAAALCEHAWLLSEGRLVAAGPLAEVFTREILEPVYGTALHVGADPDGHRTVLPRWPVAGPAPLTAPLTAPGATP